AWLGTNPVRRAPSAATPQTILAEGNSHTLRRLRQSLALQRALAQGGANPLSERCPAGDWGNLLEAFSAIHPGPKQGGPPLPSLLGQRYLRGKEHYGQSRVLHSQ